MVPLGASDLVAPVPKALTRREAASAQTWVTRMAAVAAKNEAMVKREAEEHIGAGAPRAEITTVPAFRANPSPHNLDSLPPSPSANAPHRAPHRGRVGLTPRAPHAHCARDDNARVAAGEYSRLESSASRLPFYRDSISCANPRLTI